MTFQPFFSVGYTNTDIDVYHNPNMTIAGQQTSSRSSTSRYFIGQSTVDESTQTCVEHVTRI